MKKLLTLALFIIMIACKSDNKSDQTSKENTTPDATTEVKTETKKEIITKTSSDTKSELILAFLKDIKALESINNGNPITLFQKEAEVNADKILPLTKENIKDVLATAKDFKNCVITTEDHTIVKITDINNCKPSGSWAACIPFAKGYIKKGKLKQQEDYINNIIGLPDTQIRKAYLFN